MVAPTAPHPHPAPDAAPSPLLWMALTYARMGWRVLPVHPRGKVPLIRDWPRRATCKEATVRAWWRRTA